MTQTKRRRDSLAHGAQGSLRRLIGCAAFAAALAFPANAPALTIGSDLKPAPTPNTGFDCGTFGTCAVLQTKIPGNPHPLTSPVRGVIDLWRYRKGVDDHPYKVRLLVAKKASGDNWKFVRRSRLEVIRKPAGIYRFDTHLRIRKGQYIAMRLEGDVNLISVDIAGPSHLEWYPSPPLDALTAPDYENSDLEFLWNARVRRR